MSPGQEDFRLPDLEGVEECLILERLNRFTVRVEVSEREDLVFLQNTGRLREYIVRGRRGFCAPITRPRKLGRRLFAILDDGLAAVVDTYFQSRAFEEAVNRGLIPWLEGYRVSRRNIPLAGTRIDYLMAGRAGDLLLELKSAALRLGEYASYPHCPSTRAVKQVREMMRLAERGARAIIAFIAALPNIRGFKLNYDADPILCDLIAGAREAGLEVRGVQMAYEPSSSSIILLKLELAIKI